MRILNNANNNQLPTISDMNFKVGHVIEGKIIELMGDHVLLEDVNGHRMEAKSSIPLDLSTQVMNFVITAVSKERITLKPVTKENTDADLDNIKNSLKNFHLKPTDENVELVKSLMDNGLAVTKQNVSSLIKAKIAYDIVLESYDSAKMDISPSLGELDILTVLKNLLTKGKSNLTVPIQSPISRHDHDGIEFYDHALEKSNVSDDEMKETSNKKAEITYDKLVFLLKNKLEFNISNITHMNNIVMGSYNISEQLVSLTEYMGKNPDTRILGNDLEKSFLTLKNKNEFVKDFNPDSVIKELYTKLDLIIQALEKYKQSDKKVLIHLENIKNSLEFINKINNNNQVFIQIPLQTDDTLKNMELFIRREQKKPVANRNQSLKIFLSLNTSTLKLVQVLIDMADKNITCNFQVETEGIKNIFAKFEPKLKKDMGSIGFENINLNFAVSDKKVHLLNAKEKNYDRMNSIDIRV